MKHLRNLLSLCAGAFMVLALLILVSCGGGGGSVSPTPPQNDQPTTVPQGRYMYKADLQANLLSLDIDGTVLAPGQLAVRGFEEPYMLGAGAYVKTEVTGVAVLWDSNHDASAVDPRPTFVYNGQLFVIGADGKSVSSVEAASNEEILEALGWMMEARQASVETTKRLLQVAAYHKGRPLTVSYVDTGGAAGARVVTLDDSIKPGDKILVVGAIEDRDNENWWLSINEQQQPEFKPDVEYRRPEGSGNDNGPAYVAIGIAILSLFCPTRSEEVTAGGNVTPTNHAPTINPSGPTTIVVNVSGTWLSGAADSDGDNLTFVWKVDGVVTAGSSSLTWQFTSVGMHTIYFAVSDGRGGTNSYTWNIQVTAAPPPARTLDHAIIMPAQATLDVGTSKQFAAKAYDTTGTEIVSGVTYVWQLTSAVGTISSSGLYTAAVTAGVYQDLVKVTATYDDVSKSAYADVTIEDVVTPPTGQTIAAFPSSITLRLGESQEFQIWLKDQATGSMIRQLSSSELTSWTISPAVEGESYVVATKGTIVTWQDSGAPNYEILTYMTPGSYVVHAAYDELTVDIPVTVDFAQ